MNNEIKSKIINCKNAKQVLKILNDNKIKYILDNEMIETTIENHIPKSKALDLKLVNENIRIYYSNYDKCYNVQNLVEYKIIKTGKKRVIPTCYGHTTTIDDYITIKVEK